MRKNNIFATLLALCTLAVSCEEFEPVVTFKYDDPARYEETDGDNVVKEGEIVPNYTIAQLAATYTNEKPHEITDNIIIAGRVITTDKPGNFYKSLYIQDETGAIELKIGKNSLHNDYAEGQMVYVKCGPQNGSKGLYIGSYGYKSGNYGGNGMVQLGCQDPTGDYETSYIELDYILKRHIFRGSPLEAKKVEPKVITDSDLPAKNATLATCPNLGKLVTLKGLKYGSTDYPNGEVFALLYINGNESNKNSKNRVFLSDGTWGVTSWAMSKTNFLTHLRSGVWDSAPVGNSGDQNYGTVGAALESYVQETDPVYIENLSNSADYVAQVYKTVYGKAMDANADWKAAGEQLKSMWFTYSLVNNANGYSVSHYFLSPGGKEVQLRTSGFSKFADQEIPAEVLNGTATVDLTGIVTLYQGSIQFVVNSIDDIVVNK